MSYFIFYCGFCYGAGFFAFVTLPGKRDFIDGVGLLLSPIVGPSLLLLTILRK